MRYFENETEKQDVLSPLGSDHVKLVRESDESDDN